MCRFKYRFLVAVLTFVIGFSGVSLWFLRNARNVDRFNEVNAESCAITLANKFTDPGDKADSLAEIAQLYAAAGDRTAARNLLRQALEIAKTIEDPLNQSGAVNRISRAAGEAEQLEQALLIAGTIKDSELHCRIWAYREIAENFIRLGMPDRAGSVLDEAVSYSGKIKYDDIDQKELDLSFLGQLYARSGFCRSALQTAKGFKNLARTGEVKMRSAECLASDGQSDSAFTVAESIAVYQEMQVDAFLGTAAAFVKNNDEVSSRKALENALKVARRKDWSDDSDQQTSAYVKIAKAYRLIGNNQEAARILEEAETVASSITSPNFKRPALAIVAEGFSEILSFDKALKIAGSLNESTTSAKIAVRLFEVGDKAKALEFLALDQAMPYQTPDSLVRIAEIYAANGQRQESLKLLERLKTGQSDKFIADEDAYFKKIISTYLKLKEYDLALKTALELKDPRRKVLALAAVEIEINKFKARIGEENRDALSRIGCRVNSSAREESESK
jgi:tetratricopeptide (TPR) repeat protein